MSFTTADLPQLFSATLDRGHAIVADRGQRLADPGERLGCPLERLLDPGLQFGELVSERFAHASNC